MENKDRLQFFLNIVFRRHQLSTSIPRATHIHPMNTDSQDTHEDKSECLDPRKREKRKRTLSSSQEYDRVHPYRKAMIPEEASCLLELPTELLHEICAYDGSPWSIASACTATRRVWKTTGITVVIGEMSELSAMQRAFPDATNVVFTPNNADIYTPAHLLCSPAFPRATALSIKAYANFSAEELYRVAVNIKSIVRCDTLTTCRLTMWYDMRMMLLALPPMPALARLSLRCHAGLGNPPVFGVIRDKFRSITCLRLTGPGWGPDDLDALAHIWRTATSRIKTLYIRFAKSPREMEPALHAIKASHPQLCHFTIGSPPTGRLYDADTMGSLARKFPWLQIECSVGVDLPATAYPPPGTPVGYRELLNAYDALIYDRIPESLIKGHRRVCCYRPGKGIARVPLKSLLKLIRPHEPTPIVDATAKLRVMNYIRYPDREYFTWLVAKDFDLIKSVLRSGPPTATHKTRRWAWWLGQAFNALWKCARVDEGARPLLQDTLQEIAHTIVHPGMFAMGADLKVGDLEGTPDWIRQYFCK